MHFRLPWRAPRVQVVSDVHAEFMPDKGADFVDQLRGRGVDVLIAAGDIGLAHGGSLDAIVARLVDRFPEVVFVAGNHEYYRSSPRETQDLIARLGARYSNFHPLDCGTVTLFGQRFVGASLWYPPPAEPALRSQLNDYRVIRSFTPWVYERHDAACAFLGKEVSAGDIVITHHVPTPLGLAEHWRGTPLSGFFAVEDLLASTLRTPRAWVFGHTHDSARFHIGECEYVCNPYGYFDDDLNPDFDWDCRLS